MITRADFCLPWRMNLKQYEALCFCVVCFGLIIKHRLLTFLLDRYQRMF